MGRKELTEQDKYYKLMTHFEMGMEHTKLTENGLSLNEALYHFALFHSYFCLRSNEAVDYKDHTILLLSSWLCKTTSIFGDIMERMDQTKSMIDQICDGLYKARIPLQDILDQYHRQAMNQNEILPIRYECATVAIFVKSNLMKNEVSAKHTLEECSLNLLRAEIAKERKMLVVAFNDYFYLYGQLCQLILEDCAKSDKTTAIGYLYDTVIHIIKLYQEQFMLEERQHLFLELENYPFYETFLGMDGQEFLLELISNHLYQSNHTKVLELSYQLKRTTCVDCHCKQINLGLSYFKIGEYVKASKLLKKINATSINEQSVILLVQSKIQLSWGNIEESLDCLKKCKKMYMNEYSTSTMRLNFQLYVKTIVFFGAMVMKMKAFRLVLEVFHELLEPSPNYESLLVSYERFSNGLYFCTDVRLISFLDLTSKKDNWNRLSYHSNKKIKKQWRMFKNTYLINFITQKKFL